MWGMFLMERPCSSISFPSQPSLWWGAACDHPCPTCTSVQGTLAEHPHLSCPWIRLAPGTSTFPCQVPAGCCLVPVPAAHQQGSRGPPKGRKGQQREPGIAGEEKRPANHSRTCSLALGESRQQVLMWPRARQPDPLRAWSKPRVATCIHTRAGPATAPLSPTDTKQGGSSAGIRSTDTSAQTLPGSTPHLVTEPDKPNPQHGVATGTSPMPSRVPVARVRPQAPADVTASSPAHTSPAHGAQTHKVKRSKAQTLTPPSLLASRHSTDGRQLQCRRTLLQLKCILDKSVAISQRRRRSQH